MKRFFEKYFKISLREMTEMAVLIAFSFILDVAPLKFKIVANGGSISLNMLPLFIIALRMGPIKGFLASGVIFGIFSCLFDGYGFIYYPFDYLLGFGAIAIAGFFRNFIFRSEKTYTFKVILFLLISIVSAGAVRMLASTFSGMIFYNMNFISSLAYQALYIPLSCALCFAALLLLLKPLKYINKTYPATIDLIK